MVRHEAYVIRYSQSRWELALREWHIVEPEKEKRCLQLRFFYMAKLIFTRLFSRVFHCCSFLHIFVFANIILFINAYAFKTGAYYSMRTAGGV